MVLQTILFVLAALLLGAHFLREGNLLILLLCILAPFLLLHKKRWVLMARQSRQDARALRCRQDAGAH